MAQRRTNTDVAHFIGLSVLNVEAPSRKQQGACVHPRAFADRCSTPGFEADLQNQRLHVSRCEAARFLCAGLRFVLPHRKPSMRSRRCGPDPPAVVLRLKRLRHLQRVTQPFVVDDRTLIDLRHPVIGLGCQYLTGCSDLDAPIRVFPRLDVPMYPRPIPRRVSRQVSSRSRSSSDRSGRCPLKPLHGRLAKRELYMAMKEGA